MRLTTANNTFILCPMTNTAINAAVEIYGSQKELAIYLGVVPMAITQWKQRGVPPERCIDIETATDGKVTRYDLRPDIFGPAPSVPRKKHA